MSGEDSISQFATARRLKGIDTICRAPSISLNFDQHGRVTACCFNRSHVLGRYPDDRLKDVWNGEAIARLRSALAADNLSLGCGQCARIIAEGNHQSVLIRHFDDHAPAEGLKLSRRLLSRHFWRKPPAGMPVMFEFELSNTCNLECIMCGGVWSSAIRKNREHLPALRSPYDTDFVAQVREFIPTLDRANFLGGEPFLISIYYDLWEAIVELNPHMEVAITSNGTVLNARAKKIIEALPNCKVTLSVDSLEKSTWESIRRNGDFDILIDNIDWLLKSRKLRSFSVCPMIQNFQEIPDLVRYCHDHDLDIFFNIVYGPLGGKLKGVHQESGNGDLALIPETSLNTLPAENLNRIISHYEAHRITGRQQLQLDQLTTQLKTWRDGKRDGN